MAMRPGNRRQGLFGFRQPTDGHQGLRPVIIDWWPSVRRFPEGGCCVFFSFCEVLG